MSNKPKKTICPVSREEFREQAKAITVVIDGQTLTAPAREFSTGSLGWYLNGKQQIDVGGTAVTVQIGLNLTIVGSKDLPGKPAPAADGDSGDA
jgi:hypothetical protein